MVAAWLLAALLALGCGPPSGALFTSLGPRSEALVYFPASARVLVLVRTDLDEPALEALSAALPARTRAQLERLGRTHALVLSQLRGLLGNDLAIGVPRRGAPPLAVLVTRDAAMLSMLADARVIGGHARRAGEYRGALLYRGADHAFATRDGVLLVSRDLDAVREALDRRVSQEVSYDQRRVARQVPSWKGDRPVLRAIVDAGGLVASLGPRAREMAWPAAFERLGAIVQVRDGAAVASLRLGTGAAQLVERDIPIPPGPRAPRALPGDGLSVRDAAHVAGALDGLVSAAFPLERLRVERVLRTLAEGRARRSRGERRSRSGDRTGGAAGRRRASAGVDVFADIVARLHGPATVIAGKDQWAVRIEASRPRALDRAVDRLARRLPAALERLGGDRRAARFTVTPDGGLHAVRRGRRLLVRFGVRGGALVAGTAPSRVLRSLAATPARRVRSARGGLALALSGADVRRIIGALDPDVAALWPGWRADGWLRATPARLTGELRFPLSR